MNRNKIFKMVAFSAITIFLSACSTTKAPMSVTDQSKPGFSNITDIPIPQSAQMDLDNSSIMGGSDSWTGHLVYNTERSRVSVIDFLSSQMVENGWAKISELRGKETVMVFMKHKRVATLRITGTTKKSVVFVDMANSNAENVIVMPQTPAKTKNVVLSPQQS